MDDPTSSAAPSRDRFSWFLGAAAVVLAVLVIVLGVQNRRLKREIAGMQPAPPTIEAGERLAPIRLVDADERLLPLTDALAGRRSLVLMFTPSCPACRATMPVWAELAGSAETAGVQILAVNLAPPDSTVHEEWLGADLPFPVYRVESASSPGLARITHVPATILIDAGGAVERSWFGQLDAAWAAEMRAALAR